MLTVFYYFFQWLLFCLSLPFFAIVCQPRLMSVFLYFTRNAFVDGTPLRFLLDVVIINLFFYIRYLYFIINVAMKLLPEICDKQTLQLAIAIGTGARQKHNKYYMKTSN